MIELPGWNDLISVNGFCYSSMGESPKLNIFTFSVISTQTI